MAKLHKHFSSEEELSGFEMLQLHSVGIRRAKVSLDAEVLDLIKELTEVKEILCLKQLMQN